MSLAAARGRAEWGRVATLAARIHLSMTGEALDPADLMPPQFRPDGGRSAAPARGVASKTPEDVRAEAAAMRQLFGSATLAR